MPTLDRAVALLDDLVGAGELVGWVAGLAQDGQREIRHGGRQRVDGPPMEPDTLFAIASCTKPIGGALALALVERGDLGLDEPVDRWLPELASPSVLVDPAGDLGDVVPAERPITLRHLLTMTAGFGWVVEGGPLAAAMADEGVAPGPFPPAMSPDEYLRRLAALPLAHQPGETWMYHTGFDVLGVLLARVSGRSVADLLAEHLTGPLG
ncbi:serine hydrolase, partial [Nocardioides sp.]|uniref:serine hydrolase domain-containing protein n=1 Tax=Nocardioides sp. TaxID=35761 RepID=UPI0027365CF5